MPTRLDTVRRSCEIFWPEQVFSSERELPIAIGDVVDDASFDAKNIRNEFPEVVETLAIESSQVQDPSPAAAASAPPKIYAYFAILNLALGLGAPTGLAAIPIGYFLKDHLHLSPLGLAAFVAIASTPAYFGFLFGFLRDRWRPRVGGIAATFWLGRCWLRECTYG